ncbi:MAG: hypothetical protein IJW50_05525 [Clostridia bacterium]|nr:hypothetical protein [Clostridia bacterium]
MKSKRTYLCAGFVSLLLCAVMICGTILPAAGAEVLPSLDYGNPTMENNTTLSAVELYRLLLKKDMTAGETLYWTQSDLSMTYNRLIPDSRISTDYNGEEGVLTVTMRPYTYTAGNGVTVTWIPTGASIGGKSYPLTEADGTYGFLVTDCYYSDDFDMDVEYTWEVEIAASVIEALHTDAYEQGKSASDELKAYQKKLNVYNKLLEEYEAFTSYEQWEKDYADYCAELAVYTELKKVYDAYSKEYEKYAAELDAYNQWQNYFDQMEAYRKNEEPYAEYQNYYKSFMAAVNKLAMFESVYVKEPRGWQMYADIMGSAVTQVLDKRELLVTGGCNEADILLAGQATENLRVLLKGYADIRTAKYSSDHQKYSAMYSYYLKNYNALKKNFCDLYKTLKGLYDGNTIVQRTIKEMGKDEHYRQLVGHLYVVSTCFDQNGYRDAKWKIAGRTLEQVLDPVHLIADGDWDPANTPFPAKEVAKVDRIEEPTRPTVKQPDFEPDAPTPVPNPGDPPAVVKNPYDYPKPDKVEHPGEAPAAPVFDALTEALRIEVDGGVLKAYEGVAKPTTLRFSEKITRAVSIRNLKTVTFYNVDGSILHQATVNYGESISYPMPERPDTAEYAYRPLGWVAPDGSDANMSFITEDLSLYPLYEAKKQTYTVTWVVDGVSYPMVLAYGTVPVPEAYVPISSWETQYYCYEFSGWDREVTPVTGNATYTGTMQKLPKKFTVTWYVQNSTEGISEQWAYGETPVFGGELNIPSDRYVYTFLGWDKTIMPVQGDITYTAKYEKTPLAIGGENEVLLPEHTEDAITLNTAQPSLNVLEAAILAAREEKALVVAWENSLALSLQGDALQAFLTSGCQRIVLQSEEIDGDLYYQLHFYNGNWQDMTEAQFEAQITLPYSKSNGVETLFDVRTADGWTRLESAELSVSGSVTVRRCNSYSIKAVASELCNVSKLVKNALAGEVVSFDIPCVYGYRIVGATVTTADGTQVPTDGLTFVMPAAVVTVTPVVEKMIYHVSFVVDGKLWSSAEYEAGEIIVLPEAPTKEAEEGFIYTFIGWGNVPATASGDETELVFEAVFSKAQLGADYDTGNNNNVLIEIVLPCVIAGIVLLVGGLITWRVLVKRHRRRAMSHTRARYGSPYSSYDNKK